jgi:hypothetical protein
MVSVTPLDQLAAKREASQEAVKASACPAGDPGSLDTLRTDAEYIPTPLVEELALCIQARLLARLRPLLDAELEAWMSEAIRDEVRKLAGGESVQGESYSNRHLTKHSLRKTRFVPPIEP